MRLTQPLDIGDEVSPRWPPPLQRLDDADMVYEVFPISMRSVALVTNRTIKVPTVLIKKKNLPDHERLTTLPT